MGVYIDFYVWFGCLVRFLIFCLRVIWCLPYLILVFVVVLIGYLGLVGVLSDYLVRLGFVLMCLFAFCGCFGWVCLGLPCLLPDLFN